MTNILIFPGGTEIGLEIREALKDCKNINLYSAGADVSNHAPFVFKHHFIIPAVTDSNWLTELQKIIIENKIDYVFPAHDDIVLALSENSKNIAAAVVSSPVETCTICRSKSKTYQMFMEISPSHNDLCFPVFVKPDIGQGSQGAIKIDNIQKLRYYTEPGLVIMEYLPGEEYTIDCFTDRKQGLLFVGGRERVRAKAGISMNSKPVSEEINNKFREYAKQISEKLEFHGAWFFQMKENSEGEFKLLEIAPRISGTMATYRAKGINFPLLSLYEAIGIQINIMLNNYSIEIDRALINRFKSDIKYNNVYIDFDDTLIINNKLNTRLMGFLCQCRNNEIPIILLSRSNKRRIIDILKRFGLSGFFQFIQIVPNNELKSEYIYSNDSIFIDDSFRERLDVFTNSSINTFDCSMIDMLMDDRV